MLDQIAAVDQSDQAKRDIMQKFAMQFCRQKLGFDDRTAEILVKQRLGSKENELLRLFEEKKRIRRDYVRPILVMLDEE